MNELQQLETKIRQALPRLKEDVFIKTPFGETLKIREEFREIYLSDILEWLKSFNVKNIAGITYQENRIRYIIGEWDLSKPLLKDQPKEVIEYLNQLK